jgi:Cysteine sulfinate desulfinase/cysteine desulfurase and related enzymes
MAKALRVLLDKEAQSIKVERQIKQTILHHIEQFENVTIFSKDSALFAPHILCFAIEGVRGETIVHAFEQHGIYISTTSACSSKKHLASSTLTAMGVPEAVSTSAVRVSLGDQKYV